MTLSYPFQLLGVVTTAFVRSTISINLKLVWAPGRVEKVADCLCRIPDIINQLAFHFRQYKMKLLAKDNRTRIRPTIPNPSDATLCVNPLCAYISNEDNHLCWRRRFCCCFLHRQQQNACPLPRQQQDDDELLGTRLHCFKMKDKEETQTTTSKVSNNKANHNKHKHKVLANSLTFVIKCIDGDNTIFRNMIWLRIMSFSLSPISQFFWNWRVRTEATYPKIKFRNGRENKNRISKLLFRNGKWIF